MICIRRNIDREFFFVDSTYSHCVLFAAIESWYGIKIDPDEVEVLQDFTSSYHDYTCQYLEVVDLEGDPIRNHGGGIIPPLFVSSIRSPWVLEKIAELDLINPIDLIKKGLSCETDLAKQVYRLMHDR